MPGAARLPCALPAYLGSLLVDKLVTVSGWHLPLFVMANFVSSFFLVSRHAFMSMFHTWTVKRSSGLHHK